MNNYCNSFFLTFFKYFIKKFIHPFSSLFCNLIHLVAFVIKFLFVGSRILLHLAINTCDWTFISKTNAMSGTQKKVVKRPVSFENFSWSYYYILNFNLILSLINAINSEFVGFPVSLFIVYPNIS